MAKAAPIRAKTGLHTKKLQPKLKALLVANTAEQGFSFRNGPFYRTQDGYRVKN